MKTGRTLTELAAEIDRQNKTKHDYIADTRAMTLELEPIAAKGTVLRLPGHGEFAVRDYTHGQIAAHTNIPKQYYDRMAKEAPALLANNVNTWFEKYPAARLVRTLDGAARAFLSDAYRPLDHYDFANVILEAAMKRKLEIMSCRGEGAGRLPDGRRVAPHLRRLRAGLHRLEQRDRRRAARARNGYLY